MPDPAQFVKAELEIEGSAPIPVLFNPTEFSISKSNDWKYDKVQGNALPKAQYGGGNPRELTLNLLLDKSLLSKTDHIRDITNQLFKMMEVKEGQTAGSTGAVPPFVTFKWGQETTFKSVCTQLTVAYKLFRPNGDPIRADVKMTLTQAEVKKKGQNPTTRTSHPGMGVHTVKDGDSLQSIAYKAYGDATRWRSVAEANGIDNPFRLQRGTSLTLPRLDG